MARAHAHPPHHNFQNVPCCPYLGLGASSSWTRISSSCKANRSLVNYDALDEIQIAEINSQVRRYLEGTLDEIDVRSPSSGPPCPANQGFSDLGTPQHVLCWPWNLTLSGCNGCRVGGGGPLASESLQPTKVSASMYRVTRLWVPHGVASSLNSLVHTGGNPSLGHKWALAPGCPGANTS